MDSSYNSSTYNGSSNNSSSNNGSSTNGTSTFSGDFWAQQDAEAERAEAAKYSRAQRILRAQAQLERKMAPKYEPSAMDNMVTNIMETIDGGFDKVSDLFADIAFGGTAKSKEEQPKATRRVPKKKETKKEEPLHLSKEEIEEYELEALRALVDGDQPKIPLAKLDAFRSIDPPTDRNNDTEDTEPLVLKKSFVDNDEASDLRELEIEINHYLDLIKKHEQEEKRRAILALRGDENNLLAALKEVERRHEETLLEQFQYRRQNMARDDEHQIWTYVGEYYTGGAKRPTNPSRAAPSPENILGRMAPRQESEEAKQARVNKMLDALDRRMAKRVAACRQHEDDQFERALRRRQAKKQEAEDQNMLMELMADMGLIDLDEDTVDDTKGSTQNLSQALEKANEEFYEEVKAATTEDFEKASKGGDTGLVANGAEEEEDMLGAGCLGCGTQAEDDDAAGTAADTTNFIDSQRVVYTPLNDQHSDSSEASRNQSQVDKEDPPETSWFSFFASPPPKKSEPMIPTEILLDDPPEEMREAREEPRGQAHVKKGLKIVAILEGNSEDVKVGTRNKPIIVQEEEQMEAPGGLNGLWTNSEHELLTSE